MIKKSLIIGMMSISFLGMSQTQCKGITKDKTRCENVIKKENSLCHNHDSNHVVKKETKSVVCSGITKENEPCKRKTKHSSGRCHNHRD
mgnify:CR=1 FL=1|tara:strand:+ start:109 stop:375 length:267 start_codon:yes stop_codon:yes gene_type:complete